MHYVERPQRSARELETVNRVRRVVAQNARLPAWLTVESAVSAVMCVLTERLTTGGAFELSRELPPSIAEMFEVCVSHRAGRPTAKLDLAELLDRVADHLAVTPAHAELISSAVFAAVRAELSADAIHSVAAQLPHGAKELWLGLPIVAPDLDVDLAPEDVLARVELDLARRSALPDGVQARDAICAVLGVLLRRLSGGEARHVVLGLPSSLRPLVERSAAEHAEVAEVFGRDELFRVVAAELGISASATPLVVSEVLRTTKRILPQHTRFEIESQLPPDLAELWREALPPHEEQP